MIGLIGAMDEEIEILLGAMTEEGRVTRGSFEYIQGKIGTTPVVLLKCGIGKVNAAVGTTLMIELFAPEFILNTGSAGGIGAGLAIGDVVISTEACHHDFDTTAFGYAKGQVPGMPALFPSDAGLLERASSVISAASGKPAITGLIVSGDAFIAHPDSIARLRTDFPAALAVEMESAAIAQTCYQFGVPVLIIRSISDLADHSSPADFTKNLSIATKNSAGAILKLIESCEKEKCHG